MPIYEYSCSNCREKFEFMQKITDEPIRHCPKCSGELKKLVSNTSFVLKGTGWYVTDYANKSTDKPSTETTTDTKSSEATPKETKADTASTTAQTDASSKPETKSSPSSNNSATSSQ